MWQNELQPINFANRRKKFLQSLKKGVAVFLAAEHAVRNPDVHHPYRQESNFYYLTGLEEAKSIALFSGNQKLAFQLFVQPRDKDQEIWHGKTIGPDAAKSQFGADAAHPSQPESVFDDAFIEAMKQADRLYYRVGQDRVFDQRIFKLLQRAHRERGRTGRGLWPICDPTELLAEMRQLKSKAEIERLQNAAHITAEAHINAMRVAKPGMFEYEVEAVLYHAFRVHGAGRLGYPSIVASGPNTCVLHYTANQRRMKDHELLLVDAGAEYDYYTADISRTFPVSGAFTEEQREIYGAVLTAQKAAIRLARPGKTLPEIHQTAVEVMVEELKRLKILKGATKQILQKKEYRSFYPHGTSHWLGMDVHDVGHYYEDETSTRHRKLEPGMVFTVEPGLYFSPESNAPARYKGIGVRIEDDILITSRGAEVLTSGVPKEIEEVESLCSQP